MTPDGALRIAGAPISWGVCEVPGWGAQLDAERVLAEMAEVGLAATEFGPVGFLPEDAAGRVATLRRHGLAAVGGFVPVVLHCGPVSASVEHELDAFAAAGAATLVLAAISGDDGYDRRVDLDADGWRRLCANLDAITDRAAARGITATVHPHAGTIVERPDDVRRVLDGSKIALCLDTGHLMIGGADPAELAASVADRIAHVHLKDVDAALAARVAAGELAYTAAVIGGMYRPLGQGGVDLAGIVGSLTAAGYDGWWVLEQDAVLTSEPPPGSGPIDDVRASVAFLQGLSPIRGGHRG